eukprot:gnl/Dysnectes_brevis/5213_a7394_430.p1 GENE.gnl/Dysnectes_brevis/5213_a7394_430~~gnl/Dysnectes_brevis/5213_a7394_430.p1  ORF type:complete len:1275 (-),score=191.40 gnl/Dysnectes_brevis/5213_a7394_430:39-3605(-)
MSDHRPVSSLLRLSVNKVCPTLREQTLDTVKGISRIYLEELAPRSGAERLLGLLITARPVLTPSQDGEVAGSIPDGAIYARLEINGVQSGPVVRLNKVYEEGALQLVKFKAERSIPFSFTFYEHQTITVTLLSDASTDSDVLTSVTMDGAELVTAGRLEAPSPVYRVLVSAARDHGSVKETGTQVTAVNCSVSGVMPKNAVSLAVNRLIPDSTDDASDIYTAEVFSTRISKKDASGLAFNPVEVEGVWPRPHARYHVLLRDRAGRTIASGEQTGMLPGPLSIRLDSAVGSQSISISATSQPFVKSTGLQSLIDAAPEGALAAAKVKALGTLMTDRASRYTSEQQAKLWSGSFNCKESSPTSEEDVALLREWLTPGIDSSSEFFLLSFQCFAESKRKVWEDSIQSILGGNFKLVHRSRQNPLKLHMMVYATHAARLRLRDVVFKMRSMRIDGVKHTVAALYCSLYIDSTPMLWINSHFNPGSRELLAKQYSLLVSSSAAPLPLISPCTGVPHSQDPRTLPSLFQHRDVVLWTGAMHSPSVDSADITVDQDALSLEIQSEGAWAGFKEGVITFPPTYRSGWCDRILARDLNEQPLVIHSYQSVPLCSESHSSVNHSAVAAVITVTTDKPSRGRRHTSLLKGLREIKAFEKAVFPDIPTRPVEVVAPLLLNTVVNERSTLVLTQEGARGSRDITKWSHLKPEDGPISRSVEVVYRPGLPDRLRLTRSQGGASVSVEVPVAEVLTGRKRQLVLKDNGEVIAILHMSTVSQTTPDGLAVQEALPDLSTLPVTQLLLSARDLPVMDVGGLADPYVVCHRLTGDKKDKKSVVFKTKHIRQTLDPVWSPMVFEPGAFPSEGVSRYRFDLYDWDRISRDDYIGSVTVDFSEDGEAFEKPVVNESGNEVGMLSIRIRTGCFPTGSYSIKAACQLARAGVSRPPRAQSLPFVKALHNAMQLDAGFAVSLTPSSKHIDTTMVAACMRVCVKAIERWDSDGLYELYGFGGSPTGPSACWTIADQSAVAGGDAAVREVQKALLTVNRAPVTAAAPCELGRAVRYCPDDCGAVIHSLCDALVEENTRLSHLPPRYYCLVIIVTGDDIDQENMLRALIRASALPLSVVFVGMGESGSLLRLETLCAQMCVDGVRAVRENVEIVRLSDFDHDGLMDEQGMVEAILRIVPSHFEAYSKVYNLEAFC